MLSGYALLSALVIADVFTCDKGNQTTIRSSYRLGAFAYPDERAVLTDPTHFPPLLVPEALHARFEVLLGGLLSSGKNTVSMDWPTNAFTWRPSCAAPNV